VESLLEALLLASGSGLSIFRLLVLLEVKQSDECVTVGEHALIPCCHLLEIAASIAVDTKSVETLVVIGHHLGGLGSLDLEGEGQTSNHELVGRFSVTERFR
jgi:hypothetical protein